MSTWNDPSVALRRRAFVDYFRGLQALLQPRGISVPRVGKRLLFIAPDLKKRVWIDLRSPGGRVVFLPDSAQVEAECTITASGLFFQALAARAPIDPFLWASSGLRVEGDLSALEGLFNLVDSGIAPLRPGALGSQERPVRLKAG